MLGGEAWSKEGLPEAWPEGSFFLLLLWSLWLLEQELFLLCHSSPWSQLPVDDLYKMRAKINPTSVQLWLLGIMSVQ